MFEDIELEALLHWMKNSAWRISWSIKCW